MSEGALVGPVAGVDACRKGWVAIVLDGESVTGAFGADLDDLARIVGDVAGWALDIPIGLPTEGRRQADADARAVLGPRRNSVFYTPIRAALGARTHAEASAISKRVTGHGISQQAYALAPKIFEAEQWVARQGVPVWEVHPEVSFTMLAGEPCAAPKSTWAGMTERRQVLEDAGIVLDDLGEAGAMAGIDDVLDAAAAAWSARRLLREDGQCFPDQPPTDPSTGRRMAIWA